MKAASQPPCTDVWILLEEGGVVKNFCGPVGRTWGQCCSTDLELCRSRSAEAINNCWESKRSCEEAHCVSVAWDYLEFRSIKQNKLLE